MGWPFANSIFCIFSRRMESNVLEKTSDNSIASKFFARTPMMIRRIDRFCVVVDQFLWKLFWFFERIFSISAGKQLRIINLCQSNSKCDIFVVLTDSEVTFFMEGKDAIFYPFLYRVLFIDSIVWQVNDHMEIGSLRQNQTGILPSFGCVNTTAWVHFMDANKTHDEKAKWKLKKMLRTVLIKKKSWK